MFKLNNKGFAFSTILYGLMIMGIMIILVIISTMQTNRVTNKNFVKTIEDELNRFSMTEAQFNGNGTSDKQEYIVPMGHSGWYKIEMFGSQGASNYGGKGAYTSGLVWLQENAHLYFYVGNNGAASLVTLSSDYSLEQDIPSSAIMVAAGGGDSKTSAHGGDGGSILGLNSSEGAGAKQIEGGPTRPATGLKGGHGYYNGTAGTNTGGGGSSYIAGYAGVWTKGASEGSGMTKSNASYSLEVENTDGSLCDKPYCTKDYTPQFINGFMLEGVHSGAGYAKIRKVSSGGPDNPPAKTNSALSGNITSITDCISGMSDGSSNKNNYWKEIQIINSGGENIAYGKNSTGGTLVTDGKITVGDSSSEIYDGGSGNVCLTLSGFNTPVNEVAVWHNIGLSGIQHTLKVNGVEVTKPFITNSLDTIETSNGLHYSAWSINSNDNDIPNGTYYIQSAADSRLFVTNTKSNEKNASILSSFDGSNKQKWTLTKVNGKYLIKSALDGKVFQAFEDWFLNDGISGSTTLIIGQGKIGTDDSHGFITQEQWSIEKATNDTYYFKLYFTGGNANGTAFLGVYKYKSGSEGDILYQRKFDENKTKEERAMRFRLIPVDY